MPVLTKLPAAREAELPAIREKWLGIGLRTGTGDPARAWEGAKLAYRTAGRAEPKLHLWMRSPIEMLICCYVLRNTQVRAQVLDQVLAQVSAQVSAQVRAQVLDQVGAQVRDQVRDQVLDQVGAQVRDQVSDQVGAQVSDQVLDQVSDQVRAQVRAQVRDQVGAQVRADPEIRALAWRFSWYTPGQFDGAWWISYYEALREWCDFKRLEGLTMIAESCAWAFTFPDIVIFCAPPVRIERDERNRLHSDTGAAVLFADGWGVWAHHGTRVPRQVIEAPETLAAAQVRDEPNAEVRRAMLERFGTERYLREIGARAIDRSDYGTLYRAELADDEPLVVVEVENSTPEPDGTRKMYFLRVPPAIETAREAVAWTFGVSAKEYDLQAQT